MNTRTKLIQIQDLLKKADLLLAALIETQPKQSPGKPPEPQFRSVAWELWNAWEALKALDNFTAKDAKQVVKGDNRPRHRTDSSYSWVLSQWARDGYISRTQEGAGPFPAVYKISP
jgi:hypothetical protein